jgi:hypothetical protein
MKFIQEIVQRCVSEHSYSVFATWCWSKMRKVLGYNCVLPKFKLGRLLKTSAGSLNLFHGRFNKIAESILFFIYNVYKLWKCLQQIKKQNNHYSSRILNLLLQRDDP